MKRWLIAGLISLTIVLQAYGLQGLVIHRYRNIHKGPYKVSPDNCHPIPSLQQIMQEEYGSDYASMHLIEVNMSGDGVLGGVPDYNITFCKPADRCNGHTVRVSTWKEQVDVDTILYITVTEDYVYYWQDDDNTTEDRNIDINHDGVQDDCQDNVATPQGGDYLIGVVTDADKKLYHVTKDETPKTVTTQDGEEIELPYGTVSFDVNVTNPGESAIVHIYYPYNPNITGYAKEINGNWTKVDATVQHDQTNNQTIVTFTLADGSDTDEDGSVNSVIKDPGGAYIGHPQPQAQAVTVPLSPLGLLWLASLLGLSGFVRLRRR